MFDIGGALSRIYEAGFSARTVKATRADGVSEVSQTITMTPQPDAVFEGQLRKAVTLSTLTVAAPGSLTETTRSYYSNPFMLHGDVSVTGSTYTITSPRMTLPTAAVAGDSGPFFSSVSYKDSSKAEIAAVSEATWSVDAIAGRTDSVYACINFALTDFTAIGRPVTNGAVCYQIDTSGTLLGLRTKIVFNGEPLDLR